MLSYPARRGDLAKKPMLMQKAPHLSSEIFRSNERGAEERCSIAILRPQPDNGFLRRLTGDGGEGGEGGALQGEEGERA